MNKTEINKTYYQINQAKLKEQRKLRYQAQTQQIKTESKTKLSNYYRANNIQVLVSLKDYLASSADKQKLWYRFTGVLSQIKEGVSDIIEIMRLREVTEDLISDYWTTAKKQIRINKQWNKLSFAEQQAKKNHWEKELQKEESELFAKLAKKTTKQQAKIQEQKAKKQAEINDYWNKKTSAKVECPECGKMVKELAEENELCAKCLKNYEE